jgi:hypothetical protein
MSLVGSMIYADFSRRKRLGRRLSSGAPDGPYSGQIGVVPHSTMALWPLMA